MASRQMEWKRRMKKQGRCTQCGAPRPSRLKNRCELCQEKHNARRREADARAREMSKTT